MPVLPLAYRYAVRLAGDRDAGMDLVQDASVSAYRAFARFEPGTNFRAWFLSIVTHRYFRVRRDEARLASVPLEEAPDLFLYAKAKERGVPSGGDPLDTLLAGADDDFVRAALARLPDDYRAVAALHFLSEASYAECAETLAVPVGTVRSRLHRARKLLQVALWSIGEERGYVKKKDR